jgi:hypothetical protein
MAHSAATSWLVLHGAPKRWSFEASGIVSTACRAHQQRDHDRSEVVAIPIWGQCDEPPLAWTADATCATPSLSDFLGSLPAITPTRSNLCSGVMQG